jgi:polyhydroxyalkanoate synthase subunit PhaE
MDKPMREKKQAQGEKKKEAIPDDAVQGMMKELENLWRRFSQEQMAAFKNAASANAAKAFFREDQNPDLQNRWQDFMRGEIMRCFHMTPIGPLRQYQGKFMRCLEAFAEWEAVSQAFTSLLNRPMAQSLADMQEKIRHQLDADNLVENLIPLWIRLLEKRYLALFRSEEFMATLHGALKAKTALTIASEAVMEDILKAAHVPTLRDMDELSREVYLLKKRVQTLEKELKDRHDQLR